MLEMVCDVISKDVSKKFLVRYISRYCQGFAHSIPIGGVRMAYLPRRESKKALRTVEALPRTPQAVLSRLHASIGSALYHNRQTISSDAHLTNFLPRNSINPSISAIRFHARPIDSYTDLLDLFCLPHLRIDSRDQYDGPSERAARDAEGVPQGWEGVHHTV